MYCGLWLVCNHYDLFVWQHIRTHRTYYDVCLWFLSQSLCWLAKCIVSIPAATGEIFSKVSWYRFEGTDPWACCLQMHDTVYQEWSKTENSNITKLPYLTARTALNYCWQITLISSWNVKNFILMYTTCRIASTPPQIS